MSYQGNCRLGDLFSSRREKGRAGLPTLSVTLNNGVVNREDLDRKQETSLTAEEHLLAKPGDIAYNMMRMWQGACGLVEKEGLVSPAYVVLKPKSTVDSKFASYLFKTQRMKYLFWAYSYGLTEDRLRLYSNDFARIPVNVPIVSEQLKIGEMLGTWDQALLVIEKLIENSILHKKILLTRLIAGNLRTMDFKETNWVSTHIGAHCILKGGNGFNEEFQGMRDGDYPFIKVSDMNSQGNEKMIVHSKNWISEEVRSAISANLIPSGSVVFAKVGAALLLNRRRVSTRDMLIDNNMMAAIPKATITTDFLYQLLSSIDLEKYSQEGAIPSVNQSEISAIPILLPSIEEQKKIAAILDKAETVVHNFKIQKRILSIEKEAILKRILSDERRIKTPQSHTAMA